MTACFFRLFGAAALAAIISLPSVAQEYSDGGQGASGRGPAILTPVEAFGVHRPGPDPADANRWRSRKRFVPYYAPLSPVASTARWAPWAYYPLLPYYTPYYPGYSPHRLFNSPPRPYGKNGWGVGPGPEMPLPEESDTTPLEYAEYTTVIEDDTTFWNMGGNGLVPYGTPQTDTRRAPDLVDAIQASRAHGRRQVIRAAPQRPGATRQEQGNDRPSRRRTKPAEPIPPGQASQEQEDEADPEGSSPRKNPTKRTHVVEP